MDNKKLILDKENDYKRRNLYENYDVTYGDYLITHFIMDKLNEPSNIDKTYRNISDLIQVGNYLGFENYSSLSSFNKLDLYDLYFTPFPNYYAYCFCYVALVGLLALIIISLYRLFRKASEEEFSHEDSCCWILFIVILYLIFFIGFFTYVFYEFCNIYQIKDRDSLLRIKGDPYIEDLIKEIDNRSPYRMYILIIIILYGASLVFFIFSLILNRCFVK